jgi:DNA-binding IclR family transcriptional regulator
MREIGHHVGHPVPRRGDAALDKALALFVDIVGGEETRLSVLAERTGLPRSTAQRLAASFVRHGLLSRIGHGRYAAGIRLAGFLAGQDRRMVLAQAARPLLRRLAQALSATAHLGIFEGDMITYVVKEHGGGSAVLTAEMSQLEAYCSGIGKVMLAALDDAALDAYLAASPFVALTPATITEPQALRDELGMVRRRGFAVDRGEASPDLFCLAVPVFGPGCRIEAAISVSGFARRPDEPARLAKLRECAARIGRKIGG